MIGEVFPAVLAAAQRGDEDAFTVLWRDGNPALLRYLKMIAPASAEDVTAETWVTVVRGLDRFRGGEDAWRAWLFTTARRRAVDAGRRRSRRPESLAAEVGEGHWPEVADTADQVLENLATRAAIAAVASLPPLQAEVVMLRVVAGGAAKIAAYCTAVPHPGSSQPGQPASAPTHPVGHPSHPTGKPSSHPTPHQGGRPSSAPTRH